ncbi:uncharacterized protein BYT42DRAFT_194941 [Radiomyces spectabilis]|uniref:uncharacterized protein n=1 Tax=Radiomyces spectabilis TaxID=64574 RepID=UPI00221EA43C|nr:uncharacterized protein BYT42DRAFT_194941 [Radiomyces spectabilis]KAI8391458.1 hypothetical protein BYT42DRAFT_194941 [Radiomyces spectabilis]
MPFGHAKVNATRQEFTSHQHDDTSPLHNNQYTLKPQDEDRPVDLGELQDIFSFKFFKGRPVTNFILAILWSIGLPILIYHLLKPRLGQVVAMIIAACPPLLAVITEMVKSRKFDPLALVAGLSFLISGILSIAEPDDRTAAICESIIPLLVGVFCLLSLLPIQFGSFELRPMIYQLANQIMPREEDESEELQKCDEQRLAHPMNRQQKLDWAYTHMARFRRDMRVMTAAWGATLVLAFIIKVIVVLTNTDTGNAEIYGYIIFGLATLLLSLFSWFYSTRVKKHIRQDVASEQDHAGEGFENAQWGLRHMSGTFAQVLGGG